MIGDRLAAICGPDFVEVGGSVSDDWSHDEALGLDPVRPLAVARPATTDEVVAIVQAAAELGVPVTARGSGTGLSGAAVPVDGGIVVCFDRMAAILEIDVANQVAVVEPGVTLAELDAALEPYGLVYPVFPGEQSASLGGNVSPMPVACGPSSTGSPATTSSDSRPCSAPVSASPPVDVS